MFRMASTLAAAGALILIAFAPPAAAAPTLRLEQAQRLALAQQPALLAQRADINAARERVVSAAQLPAPELNLGLSNLSLSDPNPYRDDAERMSMTRIGIRQAVPNAAKRELASQREQDTAALGEVRYQALRRRIDRDVAQAWIAVWSGARALALMRQLTAQSRHQQDTATIGFRSGQGEQTTVLAASLDLERMRDRIAELEQQQAVDRARLARWIGDEAAQEALPDSAPTLRAPPSLDRLLDGLAAHPEIRGEDRLQALAQTQIELAQAQNKPDWRVQAGYAYRQPYDDMISVEVGIDLPWVGASRRQDRELAAARERLAGQSASREDRLRRLRAQAASDYREWTRLGERLQRYDDTLLPLAQRRTDAALADYRAGNGDLSVVFDARRTVLELRLQRLSLQTRKLNKTASLQWLAAGESE